MAIVNDIVLIYLEESPVSFARVESILPDAKKDWYHIKLLMLKIPLQTVTWILKGDYINGSDFFMNGKQMRLEKVVCPPDETGSGAVPLPSRQEAPQQEAEQSSPGPDTGDADIIRFADLKNKNKNEPA